MKKMISVYNECPLSAIKLIEGDICNLSCNPADPIPVSKVFIQTYSIPYQRRFKQPPCPYCKKTEHFKNDLQQAGLFSEAYKPEDLCSLDGLNKIIEYEQDVAFALFKAALDSKEDQHTFYISCAAKLLAYSDINDELNYAGWTIAHILAKKGFLHLLKILEGEGLDLHKPLNDGQTTADIALQYQHHDIVDFLVITKGVPLTPPETPALNPACCTIQ